MTRSIWEITSQISARCESVGWPEMGSIFKRFSRESGYVVGQNCVLLPILIGAGEMICATHIFCNNDEDRRVGDGVVRPFGLGLGLFEFIDSLWYALAINMVSLHPVFYCKDTYGMDPPHVAWRWANSCPAVKRV